MAKAKLNPRERMVLMLGAVGVVLIGGYGISQGPYQAYLRSGEQVQMARQRLLDAQILQATVERDKAKELEIRQKLPKAGGFDLWTEIDKAVKDLKLDKRCIMQSNRGAAARGQESTSVTITLNGVSTKELVDLLHRVYDTGYFVFASQVQSLGPSPDKKGLNCRVTFVSPRA